LGDDEAAEVVTRFTVEPRRRGKGWRAGTAPADEENWQENFLVEGLIWIRRTSRQHTSPLGSLNASQNLNVRKKE
jgi:hypothetical protein